jgi:hypothetical protein
MLNFKNFIATKYPSLDKNDTIDSAIEKTIFHQLSKYLRKNISFELENEQYVVDWFCFVCKAAIQINIKPQLFGQQICFSTYCCKNHKDQKQPSMLSISWIRYQHSLHKKITTIIQKNLHGIKNWD